MDGLSARDLVGGLLVAVFLAALIFARVSSTSRRPQEKVFTCWRCKSLTPHNPRSIQAWRDGKTHFFCRACHAKWLESHLRPVPRERAGPVVSLVIFAVVIAAGLLARSCA